MRESVFTFSPMPLLFASLLLNTGQNQDAGLQARLAATGGWQLFGLFDWITIRNCASFLLEFGQRLQHIQAAAQAMDMSLESDRLRLTAQQVMASIERSKRVPPKRVKAVRSAVTGSADIVEQELSIVRVPSQIPPVLVCSWMEVSVTALFTIV